MNNKNIVAVALVTVVAIVAGVIVLIIIQDPDHSKVGEYLSVLVTVVVVPIITALLSVLKDSHETLKDAQGTAKDTNQVVNKLANGEMDAKIERVVRSVFRDYKGEPPTDSGA